MKNWPKGGVTLVTWPTFQILEPFLCETAKSTNIKFCKLICRKGYYTKKWKSG